MQYLNYVDKFYSNLRNWIKNKTFDRLSKGICIFIFISIFRVFIFDFFKNRNQNLFDKKKFFKIFSKFHFWYSFWTDFETFLLFSMAGCAKCRDIKRRRRKRTKTETIFLLWFDNFAQRCAKN